MVTGGKIGGIGEMGVSFAGLEFGYVVWRNLDFARQ